MGGNHFEASFLQQTYFEAHKTGNFWNVLVFQVDNRLVGKISKNDEELNTTVMCNPNINRRVSIGNGLYHSINLCDLRGMSVYWVKVLVFATLAKLYPDYNIVYADTDAVITEDLIQRIVKDNIQIPTIVNASDLGGPRGTGFYMLHHHLVQPIKKITKLPEWIEFIGRFMTKFSVQQLKFSTTETYPSKLDETQDSFEKCIQSMMTRVLWLDHN